MDDLDDESLVLAIQAGDGEAFACLVERHSRKFHGLAYRVLRHRENAEDIVQEAFLRLWRNPFAWDRTKKTKFTSWFYRVVVNLCLDHLKRVRGVNLDEAMEIADPTVGAEQKMMVADDEQRLAREISRLSLRQQTAIQLCYYDELSQADAALAMGMNLKAFQSLLFRTRQSLMQRLNDNGRNNNDMSVGVEEREHAKQKRVR